MSITSVAGSLILVVRFLSHLPPSLLPSLPPPVIGRSKLVGLPLALLLLGRDATVTIAHSKTPKEDLQALCKEADVVVGAVGMPRLIQPDWIKKGRYRCFARSLPPSLPPSLVCENNLQALCKEGGVVVGVMGMSSFDSTGLDQKR